MDIKTILGLSSAIVGAGIVVGQDPSFEYPPVQPILNEHSSAAPLTPVCNVEQDKKVSVRFSQATTDEVLKWLTLQGIKVVTGEIPKDAKIDLAVENVSLSEVLDVIGESMGGSFTKRGEDYDFQRGMRRITFQMPTFQGELLRVKELREIPSFREFQTLKDIPMMRELPLKVNLEGMRFEELKSLRGLEGLRIFGKQEPKSEKEWREFHEQLQKEVGVSTDQMKKLEQEMSQGHARGHQLSQKDAKRMEELGKEMQKRFGPSSDFAKKMKAFEEKHAKDVHKQFGPGSEFEKKMQQWEKTHGKEIESWSKNHAKELQKQFGEGSDFAKKMKAFRMESGKFRELNQKELETMMKEMQGKMKGLREVPMPPIPKWDSESFTMPRMPTMPAMPHMQSGFGFKGGDLGDIAKSLNPRQRDKNKAQGFLYWSDLTKEQQDKIGAASWSGSWTISYNKDGESFTIKSDKK